MCPLKALEALELLKKLTNLESVFVNVSDDVLPANLFVHQNLKHLHIHINKASINTLDKIFSVVPNIRTLKSNISDQMARKLIEKGKLPLIESFQNESHKSYKQSNWCYDKVVEHCKCYKNFEDSDSKSYDYDDFFKTYLTEYDEYDEDPFF
jgi:hypothetical protein